MRGRAKSNDQFQKDFILQEKYQESKYLFERELMKN